MIYNPYLLRVELDALKAHALYHEQRGRNLASFRTHVEAAEAHLAHRPRFPWSSPQSSLRKAHRSGYAALCSLNAARAGRAVGATSFMPTRSWSYPRRSTQCDVCGATESQLRFRNDFLCEACFVRDVVFLQQATRYWSAPDDATFRAFDVDAARRQARSDADRVLHAAHGEPASTAQSPRGRAGSFALSRWPLEIAAGHAPMTPMGSR